MTEFEQVNLTCERCRRNRKSLDRRRIAQVIWYTPDGRGQVRIAKKMNQLGVGKAAPGQPATRNPLLLEQRESVETLADDDDQLKEVHCRGCGAGFAYRRVELAAMAGRGRASGAPEVGIKPNLGRPRA